MYTQVDERIQAHTHPHADRGLGSGQKQQWLTIKIIQIKCFTDRFSFLISFGHVKKSAQKKKKERNINIENVD